MSGDGLQAIRITDTGTVFDGEIHHVDPTEVQSLHFQQHEIADLTKPDVERLLPPTREMRLVPTGVGHWLGCPEGNGDG